MNLVKNGNFVEVEEMLLKNKFLVYQRDHVKTNKILHKKIEFVK